MRSQEIGFARDGEATLFNDAADEIQRLLHLFAAGFLRGQSQGWTLETTTPELRFVHDQSTAHGMEMSKLIDEAVRRQADD
jgi:ribosome-binding factor A